MIVVGCLAAASALRLVGITWSLPNQTHRFTYHPDEFFQVASALSLITPPISLNPHFYNYGTLYIYLAAAASLVASSWAAVTGPTAVLHAAYLAARLVSVFLGAATVLAVFAAGRRYGGAAVAALAAFMLAVAPLHLMHSHFATVDATATFFAALALLYGFRLAAGGRAAECLVGGLIAGLAAGAKYSAGLMLLPVLAGAVLGGRPETSARARRTVLSALGAIIGFLIGTPGAVLWSNEFARGFLFELRHSHAGHGFVFAGTGSGWLFHITSTLWYGLGPPLLALTAFGFVLACVRRTKASWVLLAAFVPYYAMSAVSEVRFARYLLPVFPVLAIFAADAVAWTFGKLRNRSPAAARCWGMVCLIGVLGTLLYSIALVRLFVARDPRDAALAWMETAIPRGASIAFPTLPWFYSPPVVPETTAPMPAERLGALNTLGNRWRLLAIPEADFDISLFDSKPGYVVMSDFEVQDRLRVKDPQTLAFMRRLGSEYRLARTFANDVRLGGLVFCRSDRLPHDMRYASPTIFVWARGGSG